MSRAYVRERRGYQVRDLPWYECLRCGRRWQVAEEEDSPDFQVYHVTETAHGIASHQAYCGVEATWRVCWPIWTIYDIPPWELCKECEAIAELFDATDAAEG